MVCEAHSFPDSSAAGRNSLSEQLMTFVKYCEDGNPNAFGKQKNWEKFSLIANHI